MFILLDNQMNMRSMHDVLHIFETQHKEIRIKI